MSAEVIKYILGGIVLVGIFGLAVVMTVGGIVNRPLQRIIDTEEERDPEPTSERLHERSR